MAPCRSDMGKYGALQVWLWFLFEAKVVLNDCTYDFFFWESWQRCVVLIPSGARG